MSFWDYLVHQTQPEGDRPTFSNLPWLGGSERSPFGWLSRMAPQAPSVDFIQPLRMPSFDLSWMMPMYGRGAPTLDFSMYPRILTGTPKGKLAQAQASDRVDTTGVSSTDFAPSGARSSLEDAIDSATDDPRIRQAMRLAATLEGGNLDGNWGVGDQGKSFGPYQIYTAAHPQVSRQQAEDPVFATRFMLPEFQAALKQVDPSLWQTDPMRAAALTAFYAEKPAVMYDPNRVANGWRIVQQRMAQPRRQQPTQTIDSAGASSSALAYALTKIGKPYHLGGASDTTGFDCSGLVLASYAAAGKQLPRTAQQQFDATQRVSADALRPGDLIFFADPNEGQGITHVGIYAGNGTMVSADAPGKPIHQVSLSQPYWRDHYAGAGRVA